MTDREEAARTEILARLAASREELRRVLDPARNEPRAGSSKPGSAGFPRSRTMQALLSSRGLGSLGAAAVGLLVARPRLALRLLRMLSGSGVAKTLLLRAVAALRTRHQ